MVDRRRTTPPPKTRTFKDRARPTRDTGRDFSPVRGDLMDRARTALRDTGARTPAAPGRASGGGPGQGAIDFGRSMTGGDSQIQQVKNDIVRGVAEHLASKGIYQDDRGTWQIAGLERNDPSISIRDSAVRAMGGPSWEKIVGDADARLGANNIGLPSASPITRGGGPGMPTAPVPQTRTTSGTPTIPGRTLPPFTPGGAPSVPGSGPSSTRSIFPPLPPRPNVIGQGPGGQVIGQGVPKTGGVPAPVPQQPTIPGAGPSATRPIPPSPGGGGPIYNPPTSFPPQGQGVGRGTTPTGAEVDPTTYPRTDVGTNDREHYPGQTPAISAGMRIGETRTLGDGTTVKQQADGSAIIMPPQGDPFRIKPDGTRVPGVRYGTGGYMDAEIANMPMGGNPQPMTQQGLGQVLNNIQVAEGNISPQGQRQNFQGPTDQSQGIVPVDMTRTTPTSMGSAGPLGPVLGAMEASRQSQPLHGLFGGTGQEPAPSPGLGGVPAMTNDIAGNPQGIAYQGYQQPISPSNQGRTDVGGVGAGTPPAGYPPPTGGIAPAQQSQFPGGPQTPYPQAGPVISPTTAGNQAIDPMADQRGRIGGGTGGQVIGQGTGAGGLQVPPPGGQVQQQAPISPTTAGNQVVPQGNTVSRGTAPVAQPPARPQPGPVLQPGGQVGGTFPNGRVFGSNQGSPFGPDFPFGPGGFQARSGGRDLSTLGTDIAARVQAAIAGGNRGGMPGQGGLQNLQGLGDRIAQQVQGQIAGNRAGQLPGLQPGGVGTSLNEIMQRVQSQLAQSRMPGGRPDMTMPGPGQPTTGGTTLPGGTTVARGPAPTGSAQMTGAATQIIRQETGGADLTGQTNCTIRPEAGCLALNSGIFESTARSMGLDFNQIVNDPVYAQKAVEQLLSSYVNEDAGGWTGHVGQTVWEYGEANLPGGGMEAVARYYFGGCATNGCFTDEQGRSVDTYGQQFMEKMGSTPQATNIGQAPTANTIGQGGAPNGGTLGLPTSAPASSIGTGAGPQGQQAMGFQFPIQEAPFPSNGTLQGDLIPNEVLPVPGTGPAQGTIANPTTTTVGGSTGGPVNGTIAMPTGAGPSSDGQPMTSISAESTKWADTMVAGGSAAIQSGGYGYGADQGLPYYEAYNDMWPCATCHPGVDVGTDGAQPYQALDSGKVTCIGSKSLYGDGGGAIPSGMIGCGAYTNADGGPGNISVLKDDGALMIYGHSQAVAQGIILGSQVNQGTSLGVSGNSGDYCDATGCYPQYHIHAEVQLPIGDVQPDGSRLYVPVDPNLYYANYYCGQGYCVG